MYTKLIAIAAALLISITAHADEKPIMDNVQLKGNVGAVVRVIRHEASVGDLLSEPLPKQTGKFTIKIETQKHSQFVGVKVAF